MIVHDLDIVRVAVAPAEADPPLVVDANAVLAAPIALERFQPVARWHSQVIEALGGVELHEFPKHDPLELRRESAAGHTCEETLGLAIDEAPDHPEA